MAATVSAANSKAVKERRANRAIKRAARDKPSATTVAKLRARVEALEDAVALLLEERDAQQGTGL